MNCYKWELEAILEGLALKNVDKRENYAELASNIRYTMHAKKVKFKQMFNKSKEESKVIQLFKQDNVKQENELAKRIKKANDYFRNKNKK